MNQLTNLFGKILVVTVSLIAGMMVTGFISGIGFYYGFAWGGPFPELSGLIVASVVGKSLWK